MEKFTEICGNPRASVAREICIHFAVTKYTVNLATLPGMWLVQPKKEKEKKNAKNCALGQADGCGHSTKTTVAWAIGLMATFVSIPRRNSYRDFRSVFAILVFMEFRDEKRPITIFAEMLDQERAQVPLWGPAPVSAATFLRFG
jgi:hypothetical protein